MNKRISDDMLGRIALTLGIPVDAFSEDNDRGIYNNVDLDLSLIKDTLELIDAFHKIDNTDQRRACINFTKAVIEKSNSTTK